MVDSATWAERGVTAEQGRKADAERLRELLQMLAAGTLREPEVRVVNLAEAGQAIEDVGHRHNRGKVVNQISG